MSKNAPVKAPTAMLNPNACWGNVDLTPKPAHVLHGTDGRDRCRKTGVYEPTVRVWPSAWAADRKAANFQMVGMAYCAECSAAAQPEDLMDANMRAQVDATFKADGKPLPDWKTVKVVWNELRPRGDVAMLDMAASGGPAS